jgi:hypothetical protein
MWSSGHSVGRKKRRSENLVKSFDKLTVTFLKQNTGVE